MTISGGERIEGTRRRVLEPDALFQALADAEVNYILVGGLAVAAHGHIRATQDLDLCPEPSDDNLARLADLLAELGATNQDTDEFGPDELATHDLEGLRGGGNFRLMTTLGALDVMQYLEPFGDRTWEKLDQGAELRHAFGNEIRVCGYRDLLAMKTEAGREQDQLDIKNLKAANREL